jgi:sirohydrochlorin ferrochelatase
VKNEVIRATRILAVAALAAATAATLDAQSPRNVVGTVLVAHGAGPDWNNLIYDMAREVRTGGPVEVSFLMGPAAKTTRFQDVIAKLERSGASEIVVVPVLVSSHSGHYDQIRYLAGDLDSLSETMLHHLHMAGIERPRTGIKVRLAKAVDDSPDVARVVADRARKLAPSQEGRALFLIGHGPNSAEDYAAWMANLRKVVAEVRRLTGFADVRVDLVRDDAPAMVRAEAVLRVRELIELQHRLTGQPVVVVPVAISQGQLTREKLPRDMAGLPIVYDGEALLPHPAMARWVEARVRETSPGAFVGGGNR